MNDKEEKTFSMKEVARIISEVALESIYKDPHQWSTRPCGTCRSMTSLLGFDVGCIRYAKEKAKKAQ